MLTITEIFRKFTFLVLLSASTLTLAACNTMEGAGKDVKAAGDKLEESADENNNYENRAR